MKYYNEVEYVMVKNRVDLFLAMQAIYIPMQWLG